jgi:hypothetical protein
MGVFQTLKYVGQAMKPAAIKQGLEASRASMSGAPAGPTEEQLAALTPEQRRAYEANMAQVAQAEAEVAAAQKEFLDRELGRRALYGPAGAYVYGDLPAADVLPQTVEESVAMAKEQFLDVLRHPFRAPRPQGAPPPSPLSGTGDREQQAAEERAARDAARAPYLAPDRPPMNIARLATREKTQIGEVSAYLGSSGLAGRPDLVYGVYRVPDHVVGGGLLGLGINKPALVEWEVVHAATPGMPAAPPATVTHFSARDTWAARRPGEPSILDEDLGLEYFRAADLGPEQSLGIARFVEVDAASGSSDSGGGTYVVVGVTGLVVLHPAGLGAGIADQMKAHRPLQVLPAPDVHIAILNWGDIRRVVAPRPDQRCLAPSPFPHLPSTGAELLEAYLAVVGVRPQDCYSAQVTLDQPSDIIGGTAHVTTTSAEAEIAADGVSRKRFRGGSRIVVAYRDAPDYAAGRERWAAYQREVLQTTLEHRIVVREPLDRMSVLDRGALGKLVRGVEAVGSFVEGDGDEPFRGLPYYRYC